MHHHHRCHHHHHHKQQENNSSLGNAHHATHQHVVSHVAQKLRCEEFSRQFVSGPRSPGSNSNATGTKVSSSFLMLRAPESAFGPEENHNSGYNVEGGEQYLPLPPPPSLTPQTTNDVSSFPPRYVTEIKLKIKNPAASSVDRNESAMEGKSMPPVVTRRISSSNAERELEFRAVPGRAIRHEESFLPPPPPPPQVDPPLPRIPRMESKRTSQLQDGFATFARKPRRKQIQPQQIPHKTKYQEINYPARLTYENHSPSRPYQMSTDQFNLHAALNSKSTPAIQTGDSSAATSIHELLHGSSLLNLENLLRAPDSFVVMADDESSTMALSSPTDSLEYTKCWRTPTTTQKSYKTERRPPAHVGGEFNSCGIQVTGTGLAGDYPGPICLMTKKTFSNVEVQTSTPLGVKGVEDRGCGATPEKHPILVSLNKAKVICLTQFFYDLAREDYSASKSNAAETSSVDSGPFEQLSSTCCVESLILLCIILLCLSTR